MKNFELLYKALNQLYRNKTDGSSIKCPAISFSKDEDNYKSITALWEKIVSVIDCYSIEHLLYRTLNGFIPINDVEDIINLFENSQENRIILVSDIRGSTAMAEQTKSQIWVENLQSYYTDILLLLHSSIAGGISKKRIGRAENNAGDAIVCSFPKESAMEALVFSKKVIEKANKHGIRVGVGLHYGAFTSFVAGIGNQTKRIAKKRDRLTVLKEQDKRDITLKEIQDELITIYNEIEEEKEHAPDLMTVVIGDAINLTARIESLTKELPYIMFTQDFLDIFDNKSFAADIIKSAREFPWDIQLRGKKDNIVLWALHPNSIVVDSNHNISIDPEKGFSNYRSFSKGMLLYKRRQYPEAREIFLGLLGQEMESGHDMISRLMLKLIDDENRVQNIKQFHHEIISDDTALNILRNAIPLLKVEDEQKELRIDNLLNISSEHIKKAYDLYLQQIKKITQQNNK